MQHSNSKSHGNIPELAPGTTVGRYRIVKKESAGGCGVVYRALDTELEREVALKLLPPDVDGRDHGSYLAEARTVAAVNHPGIATVYETGEHHGCP